MDDMDEVTEPKTKQSYVGSIIGAAVLLGVLLLGALYIWGAKIEKERQLRVREVLMEMEAKKNTPSPPPLEVAPAPATSTPTSTEATI